MDRSRILPAPPPLPHLLDVLQGAMELAKQEWPLLAAHAVIEQPPEQTFPKPITKSKKLRGLKSRYCFKTKQIDTN
jgi:hypothetical protein